MPCPRGPIRSASCLLEAWANGKPNLAYRAGGPAELIHHRDDGLLARCGDVEDLATSLGELVSDAGLRNSLGESRPRTDRREFGWKDKLELVERVLRRCHHRVLRMTKSTSPFGRRTWSTAPFSEPDCSTARRNSSADATSTLFTCRITCPRASPDCAAGLFGRHLRDHHSLHLLGQPARLAASADEVRHPQPERAIVHGRGRGDLQQA